jgi:copper resistance protein C
MGKRLIVTAAVISLCAIATAAGASPRMISVTPGAKSVVTTPPNAVRILFNEPVAETASGAAIANDKGQIVDIGKAVLNSNNPRQLVIPIRGALEPGMYTVVWHAVGRDTVRVTGTYQFEVKQ